MVVVATTFAPRHAIVSSCSGVPANVLLQGYDESVYDERGDQ